MIMATKVKVAYLGPKGTFTEQAARSYFLDNYEFIEYRDIPEVFTAISSGFVKFGVVPIENSIEGSVNIALDLLFESDFKVSGEIEQRIIQNLISEDNVDLTDVKKVISHPQAIAQCRNFLKLKLPKSERIEVASTSTAIKTVKGSTDLAAIGSELAAKSYKMKILCPGIEDNPNNSTRFFVLSQQEPAPTGNDKTTIIFSVKHAPGALYDALGVFASRDINLTKIESRPTRKKPWEYIFYCGFEGHKDESLIQEVLIELKDKTTFLKVLGSYPKAKMT
jgi:prephenate dehydratase